MPERMDDMAITKLDHIKENKKGRPSAHLAAVLIYILNPDKTEDRLWCGGNCSVDPKESYELMMDRKREFGKLYGRQGYHFVISFLPGECDEQTAFFVVRDFCEAYLGNEYQYVFSIHNDQAHMHGHIVFNSISQIDGYKYRYVDGDWEKDIQPITDEICKRYGLSELVYDVDHKKGISYAEWLANKEGRITGKDIIRADIDYAIQRADTPESFETVLKEMGYQIRKGNSRIHGEYYSFLAPGLGKARRDYKLGDGYSLPDIERRIKDKGKEQTETLPALSRLRVLTVKSSSRFQVLYARRIRQATDWHYFAFLRKEQSRVRQDLLKIDRLHEECAYLIEHDLKTIEEVEDRRKKIRSLIRSERIRLRSAEAIDAAAKETEEAQRYRCLSERIKDPDITDEELEEAMDEIEILSMAFPYLARPKIVPNQSAYLEGLMRERSILNRIVKEAPVLSSIREMEGGAPLNVEKDMRKEKMYEQS